MLNIYVTDGPAVDSRGGCVSDGTQVGVKGVLQRDLNTY